MIYFWVPPYIYIAWATTGVYIVQYKHYGSHVTDFFVVYPISGCVPGASPNRSSTDIEDGALAMLQYKSVSRHAKGTTTGDGS